MAPKPHTSLFLFLSFLYPCLIGPLKLLFLTLATYILPTLIHRMTLSFSCLYDLLSRRARSPFAPEPSWADIVTAGVVFLAWHVWLVRLSYFGIMEGRKKGVSWGRVLGRIVVPGGLLLLGVGFGVEVRKRTGGEVAFVKGNDA